MKKNPGGRPKKLTDELIEKAKTYIDEYTTLIPSVAGLAVFLNISRASVYLYANQSEEFKAILEQILANQELICLEGGLSKQFDSGISKLVLGKHGYKEHRETDLNDNRSSKEKTDAELEEIASSE